MDNLTSSYSVDVIGRTWGGGRSTYTYETDRPPRNAVEVKRVAGDFSGIEDYRVTKREEHYEDIIDGIRQIIDTTIVTDWQLPESDVIWDDANEYE